jgi:diaminopimelate decarboxylase
LYDAYHTIVPVQNTGKKKVKVDVVGPVCESGDFFAKARMIPEMKEREYLAILNAGAYGMSMSSRYNSHPFIEEVMVDGRNIKTIRKPESYDEMTRNEVF